jgi:valyl-tRNA synthetase
VTEELYAAVKPYAGESTEFLLNGGYQNLDFDWSNPEAEKEMARVMGAVTSIRSLRAQLSVPLSMKIAAFVDGPFAPSMLEKNRAYVTSLAGLGSLDAFTSRPAQSATAVADGATFYIPLAGVIDIAKERERLAKELAKAEEDLVKCEGKLKNLSAAPNVPAEKLAEAKAQRDAVVSRRGQLGETLKWLA